MATTIIMPKQGLQMTEGLILRWLAKEGDTIREGQPLFEMETDKLTITIDANVTGTLLKILRGEGELVPITEVIAIAGEPGEDISGLLPSGSAAASEQPESAPAPQPEPEGNPAKPVSGERVFATPRARMHAQERQVDLRTVAGSGPDGLIIDRDIQEKANIRATPLARKEAEKAGVALDGIAGTGSHGKIVLADVLEKEERRPDAAARDAEISEEADETAIPLTGMRRIIARRMKESLTEMAQANHRMEADMTEAVRLRDQLKAQGIKVSYNDIVLYCTARALTEYPRMNSVMTDNAIIEKRRVHLGMAVATEDGLLVPVIRDADRMKLQELGGRARELGRLAREGGLRPDDMTGGTFTVTNLGMFGVDTFTPIINAPEAGILGVGQIRKKAVVLDDDSIAVRSMMWLSLTYDHRVIDGAPAAQFLRRVKQLIEQPALLL
ncbi:MAG: 2-oxo acid dehydrogenase subunit E2 [Clostridia bacterium]|nr:2-oxo acid dehydrogenase subunit E2 [Clostridia bacterium]